MYPALATAQALLRDSSEARQLYFVGAAGGMEVALVRESALGFSGCHQVLAGPLHGVHPLRALVSLVKLKIGTGQALIKLMRINPDVILLTGGWANLPVALGARMLRIPAILYLPDIEPGLTIKVLQRFAAKVAITVEASARYFPQGKTIVVGYPLQENRLNATREQALERFKLDASRKTLLVFGGSRGARSINIALGEQLGRLVADGIQILHVTGELDWERAMREAGDLQAHPDYQAFPYLHDDMALAFAAADLALCRAGASTLAELPLFGLPAILVPYPYAWRYQKVNADYLSDRGAAIRLNDEDLPARLYDEITNLMQDEARLREMGRRSRTLANPDGAANLAKLLIKTGGA
ncbi:MAG: UDP-N-acetylglucosamine--N-acetylmuramyl-(pentapeptide) pyrophosphoryl-undecaprenol N-acetylglucosamine transferase [Chloroflexota bacterium]|nr:UDP-N-acetylglucosamine--N-acetylmuramyl-(pentapeptide) pyrophosphoryl-undecaprenol N-acetylglucosamine transferase [Chloroflexota bacterium]MDE2948686.1 UDP-N-acetylglucosamine--N-acetylmuramyl-(pentapeptide) pyrophosphoryl-undecaprenol N-acetylglucosamine transferase [Chloroflexota bacterium]